MDKIIEVYYRINYNKLVKSLMFKCFGIKEDAEDIVQEAFTRALKYKGSFDKNGSLKNWFNRILWNSYKNWKIEKYHHPDMEELDEESPGFSLESLSRMEKVKDVFQHVENEEEGDKEILILYFKEGFSKKEVSQITNNSYTSITRIVKRFKKKAQNLNENLYRGY